MVFQVEQEKVLWQVGEYLAEEGLPLGFLNSEGFNPSFKLSETKVAPLVAAMRKNALKDLPFTIGSSKKFEDLRFALWLLTNTYCYVVTSPYKSEELQGFNLGQQEVRLGSLSVPLLEQLAKLSDRQKTSLSKIYTEFTETLSSGLLNFPTMNVSKVTFSFPRKKMSFLGGEYMVLPVSVVNGYVSKLKKKSRKGIVTLEAHRVGGALREFNLTSNSSVAFDLYTDKFLLEEIESVGYNLQHSLVYQDSKAMIMKGLTRLLLTFYDLGISETDYPQRQLSLSRIRKVTYLGAEEQAEKLKQLKRYSLMSEDAMVRQITHLAKDWSSEKQTAFLLESLSRLKKEDLDGQVSSSKLQITSTIEFQMRFSECIEFYSTAYLRAVYDMLQENPERFNYVTGHKTEIDSVVTGIGLGSVVIPDTLEF